jgi:hypothetical protein
MGPSIPEILWNFSRHEGESRLTLAQNPHFYVDLPRSKSLPSKFKDRAHYPITPSDGTVYVLTNSLKRVFIHNAGKWRAFDNVFDVDKTFLLKGLYVAIFFSCFYQYLLDIDGRLESETFIDKRHVIPDGFIIYHRGKPPHSAPAPGTTLEVDHWREPVRSSGDGDGDTYVCITCKISKSGTDRSCACEAP